MARKDDKYVQAIDGKKIPILTLDQKWHRLFTQTGVSAEIKRKEEKVNELLKKQGGLQTRQKDIKRLKNKLMQEVLSSMEGEEKPKGRSREENGKLIEECNEKPGRGRRSTSGSGKEAGKRKQRAYGAFHGGLL